MEQKQQQQQQDHQEVRRPLLFRGKTSGSLTLIEIKSLINKMCDGDTETLEELMNQVDALIIQNSNSKEDPHLVKNVVIFMLRKCIYHGEIKYQYIYSQLIGRITRGETIEDWIDEALDSHPKDENALALMLIYLLNAQVLKVDYFKKNLASIWTLQFVLYLLQCEKDYYSTKLHISAKEELRSRSGVFDLLCDYINRSSRSAAQEILWQNIMDFDTTVVSNRSVVDVEDRLSSRGGNKEWSLYFQRAAASPAEATPSTYTVNEEEKHTLRDLLTNPILREMIAEKHIQGTSTAYSSFFIFRYKHPEWLEHTGGGRLSLRVCDWRKFYNRLFSWLDTVRNNTETVSLLNIILGFRFKIPTSSAPPPPHYTIEIWFHPHPGHYSCDYMSAAHQSCENLLENVKAYSTILKDLVDKIKDIAQDDQKTTSPSSLLVRNIEVNFFARKINRSKEEQDEECTNAIKLFKRLCISSSSTTSSTHQQASSSSDWKKNTWKQNTKPPIVSNSNHHKGSTGATTSTSTSTTTNYYSKREGVSTETTKSAVMEKKSSNRFSALFLE